MNRNKEQIQYFSTKDDGTMIKIIVSAVVFHLVVVFVLYGLHCIDTSKPAKEIPVFELVQIDEPVKQHVVAETPLEPENETPKEEIPPEVAAVFAETARWLDLFFAGKDPGFTPALAPERYTGRRAPPTTLPIAVRFRKAT